MKPSQHVILSTVVSILFWFWLKNISATVVCFLSGILIDLDHHLDYIMITKKIPWRYKDLKEFCVKHTPSKFYCFLHSYELFAVLWLCIWVFNLNDLWLGFAIGVTTHIIFDQIYNPIKPQGYTLTYRMIHNFDRNKVLRDGHQQKLY